MGKKDWLSSGRGGRIPQSMGAISPHFTCARNPQSSHSKTGLNPSFLLQRSHLADKPLEKKPKGLHFASLTSLAPGPLREGELTPVGVPDLRAPGLMSVNRCTSDESEARMVEFPSVAAATEIVEGAEDNAVWNELMVPNTSIELRERVVPIGSAFGSGVRMVRIDEREGGITVVDSGECERTTDVLYPFPSFLSPRRGSLLKPSLTCNLMALIVSTTSSSSSSSSSLDQPDCAGAFVRMP